MQKQIEPILIGKSEHIAANQKRLWETAKADIQNVLDLYKETGLPGLTNAEFSDLFNNTSSLMYDKITGGGHTHVATTGGSHIPIDKDAAMAIIKKPVGFDALMAGIKRFVGTGHKFYQDSAGKEGFAVNQIIKYFMLDELGNLQYTAYQLDVFEECGKKYIRTDKGQDTYKFTQEIAKAFFENNMDKHIPRNGNISADILFEFLGNVMSGINYSTKEVIPIHRTGYYGYYADNANVG